MTEVPTLIASRATRPNISRIEGTITTADNDFLNRWYGGREIRFRNYRPTQVYRRRLRAVESPQKSLKSGICGRRTRICGSTDLNSMEGNSAKRDRAWVTATPKEDCVDCGYMAISMIDRSGLATPEGLHCGRSAFRVA